MSRETILTQESYNKLKKELEYLSTTKRIEIAYNLKVAAEHGDLKENAEFDAERDRQAVVESRINEIKKMLSNSKIIELSSNTDTISIGSTVVLYDAKFDEELEYKIVDSIEADPLEGKLSHLSPVGTCLINKKSGDNVEVQLPKGKAFYKVIQVK